MFLKIKSFYVVGALCALAMNVNTTFGITFEELGKLVRNLNTTVSTRRNFYAIEALLKGAGIAFDKTDRADIKRRYILLCLGINPDTISEYTPNVLTMIFTDIIFSEESISSPLTRELLKFIKTDTDDTDYTEIASCEINLYDCFSSLRSAKFSDLELCECCSDVLRNNNYIKKLVLDSLPIGNDGIRIISEASKFNRSLSILSLSATSITDIAPITEMLKVNRSLQELYLNGCYIGDKGSQSLSEALKFNNSLVVLDCSSTDVSGSILAEGLKKNSSLLKLGLASNFIGIAGATSLSQGLSNNTTITQLDLSHNSMDKDGIKLIADMCEANTTLTEVSIDENPGLSDDEASDENEDSSNED